MGASRTLYPVTALPSDLKLPEVTDTTAVDWAGISSLAFSLVKLQRPKAAACRVFLLSLVLGFSGHVVAATFHDAETGLRFQPPAGWTEIGMAGATVAFRAPEQVQGGWPSLNLIVTTSAAPITEKVVQEGLVGIRNGVPNIRHYSQKRVRIAGATAYQLSYDGTSQGKTLHADQLVMVRGNRVYTLTGMAPSGLSSRFSPLFQKVFQTVRFDR